MVQTGLPCSAPGSRVRGTRDVRGIHRKLPHLPVVGAGNSFDPGPARLRQEAKRGAQWQLQPPIGEEIGAVAATTGVL